MSKRGNLSNNDLDPNDLDPSDLLLYFIITFTEEKLKLNSQKFKATYKTY
jgi:hypothetical protein